MKLSIMTGGITLRFGMERGYELIREADFYCFSGGACYNKIK